MAVAHLKYLHTVSLGASIDRESHFLCVHVHTHRRTKEEEEEKTAFTAYKYMRSVWTEVSNPPHIIAILSLCSHFRCISSVYVCTLHSMCVCLWRACVFSRSFLPLLALQIQIVADLLSISSEICRFFLCLSVSVFALHNFPRVHLVLCMHLAHTRHI